MFIQLLEEIIALSHNMNILLKQTARPDTGLFPLTSIFYTYNNASTIKATKIKARYILE